MVVDLLSDFKARDVRTYPMEGRSPLADVFIVASGDAGKHIDAMADALRVKFKSETRHSIEGSGSSGWVLIDIGDIVVHLFTDEKRHYYGLDELWSEHRNAGTR